MKFRKTIGWGVALAYAWKRRGVLRKLREGWMLPIVFHAAKAEEVRAILAWLKRAGVLEQRPFLLPRRPPRRGQGRGPSQSNHQRTVVYAVGYHIGLQGKIWAGCRAFGQKIVSN